MKKLIVASGLVIFLLLPICSSISLAGGKQELVPIEPSVDFEFVVLSQNQSKSVTANIGFPLDFKVIPILAVGEGSGVLRTNVSRTSPSGELIYIFQRFPGVVGSVFPLWATDFSIGVTPITLGTSTKVTLGPDWAIGYVITGILISPETPPYKTYTVSLSF